MIPLQKWWQAPYFWAGTKFYDFLAGSENIESSYYMTKSKALDAFPMLKKEGLFGALVYYGKPWAMRFLGGIANNIRWCTQRLPHERFPGNDSSSLRCDGREPSRGH